MVNTVLQSQVAAEAPEETFDTSEPAQVNKARIKVARTRADRLKFVEAAMQHEQGRAWFYDTLNRCHIFENLFRADPYETAFRCGESNVGRMILADVQEAAPKQYLVMIEEQNGRK